jgi:methionyl aminopeptidase
MQIQRPKIRLKTPAEIDKMRRAGRVVAEALLLAERTIAPGVTTAAIDAVVEAHFEKRGAQSLFKGYQGKVPFPAVTCISVNQEVVHGIPSDRTLKSGDIVTVDTGCRLDGWCGDSAITVPVGEVAADRCRLIDTARKTLELAVSEMVRQRKWSQVAQKMQDFVHQAGYSVVEQFVGHGIGEQMHEDPQVPNYVGKSWLKDDFWLDIGLVIAVEPMVNMGGKRVKVLPDHWTVETVDGLPSVHVEHTLAITSKGVEILTSRDDVEI